MNSIPLHALKRFAHGRAWKIKGLLLLFLIPTAAIASAQSENLLPNPSFELGSDMPEGWNVFAYDGTQFRRDPSVSHSGESSAMIGVELEGANAFPCFNYSISNVRPGEEYEASVWVKTENVKANWGAYLTVEFFAGNERLPWTEGGNSGGGDRDWQQLRTRAIVPDRADKMMIAFGIHAEGKVWFDDARLASTGVLHQSFTGASLNLSVHPERIITSNFLGFGAHGDYYLTHPRCRRRGVDDRDLEMINRRIESMRPGIILLFFNYQWWEPQEGKQTPDSEEMQDLVYWIRFLKSIGTDVAVTAWGDNAFYSDWMLPNVKSYPVRPGGGGPTFYLAPKLPLPEKRKAVVRSFVDLLHYLCEDQGLDNVRYASLMCEPDNDSAFARGTDPLEYLELHRTLDSELQECGIREQIQVLGPHASGGPATAVSRWMKETLPQGHGLFDVVTAHTYSHQDTRLLPYWVRDRVDYIKSVSAGQPSPFMIAEFGYGGGTFNNPENTKYEYGLFLADFAVTSVREGASAVLMWCLMDTYYQSESRGSEPKQEYGLWRFRDEGWRVRPGFYSWSLINRYTKKGSKVLDVESQPVAESIPATAFLSPEGEMTVMVVNRGNHDTTLSLNLGLKRETVMRAYCYSEQTVPTPRGSMIGTAPPVRYRPGQPLQLDLPTKSFVLLTEVR